MWAGPRSAQPVPSPLRREATTFRSSLTIFGFNAPIYANLFDDEVAKELSVARGGRKDCLRRTPHHPARLQWAGLQQDGQSCPCRTANEYCAQTSEDLTPSQRRHPDLRHGEKHMIANDGGRDGKNGRYCCTKDRRPRY